MYDEAASSMYPCWLKQVWQGHHCLAGREDAVCWQARVARGGSHGLSGCASDGTHTTGKVHEESNGWEAREVT